MLYQCEIRGIRPIIHHSGAGLDPRTPANLEKAEIVRKRGSNRTESDEARLRELDCLTALWLDGDEAPAIPSTALRACIETAARKLKQGPQVREAMPYRAVLYPASNSSPCRTQPRQALPSHTRPNRARPCLAEPCLASRSLPCRA